MNKRGTRERRIRNGGEGFTDDEKRAAISLSSSRDKAAKMLGVGLETLQELLTPHGRVQTRTLEKVRSRLAQLKAVGM